MGTVLGLVGLLAAIPGLHPVDASSTPSPADDNQKNVSRHFQVSPEEQNSPRLRTSGVEIVFISLIPQI